MLLSEGDAIELKLAQGVRRPGDTIDRSWRSSRAIARGVNRWRQRLSAFARIQSRSRGNFSLGGGSPRGTDLYRPGLRHIETSRAVQPRVP